jgi:hypothetical protein
MNGARLKLDIQENDLTGYIHIYGNDNFASLCLKDGNERISFSANKKTLVSLATAFLVAAEKLSFEAEDTETVANVSRLKIE